MKRVETILVIEAMTRDGVSFSKKRIRAIEKSLQDEGFHTQVKRKVE